MISAEVSSNQDLRVGHMGVLALMVISPKNWEFLAFFMSTLWIIQPHLKFFVMISSESTGREASQICKNMI